MIRVCHLTSVHPADDPRIFHKECVSLAGHGYDVTLVAANCKPGIHKGVKRINVSTKKGSRLSRFTRSVEAVYREAVKTGAAIYHLHDPELLRLAPRFRRKNKIVIYDAHEDLPRQVHAKPWIPGAAKKLVVPFIEFAENHFAKHASGIITSTPQIRKRFEKINSNVEDISNFPIVSDFIPDWNHKKNEVCYIGSITPFRGIENMIHALEKIQNIRFNLAGYVSDEYLSHLRSASGWNFVHYAGYARQAEQNEILSRSMAGLVTLLPLPNYMESQPTKMYEYMAAGIPVIASAFPVFKELINRYQCGLCVDPENPDEIAAAVQWILSNPEKAKTMGLNGRAAVEKFYNWKNEEKKLLDFYARLIS